MFEHAKSENDGGVRKSLALAPPSLVSLQVPLLTPHFQPEDYRDFRVTNQTNTINMFQQAVAALSDRYIWCAAFSGMACSKLTPFFSLARLNLQGQLHAGRFYLCQH